MSGVYNAGSAGELWSHALQQVLESGRSISPRGEHTLERLGVHYVLTDPRANIFVNEARKLNYRFMIAEWLWMAFGRDDVKTIAHYNPQIAKFSDNGIDFNGSYGVPIHRQLPYIVHKLRNDPDTRQAVIQIYNPPTRRTKDVPCTLSMQFLMRDNKLVMMVNMRSSDVWLGLPYDIFNFTQIGEGLAAIMRKHYTWETVQFDRLHLNLASSHLYERNRVAAIDASFKSWETVRSPNLPDWTLPALEEHFESFTKPAISSMKEPWLTYAWALQAENFASALRLLRTLDA